MRAGTTSEYNASSAAATPSPSHAPRHAADAQRRIVIAYTLVALAALLPGLLLAKMPSLATALPSAEHVRRLLEPIRFGSGLRFWLGVTGATMIGLLVLYPLRKLLGRARWLGHMPFWFHLHLAFGLFGPVVVLYHSNFGLGGTNANVALWSMLLIALSGLVGYFVHTPASAAFWADKQAARFEIEAIDRALAALGLNDGERSGIAAAFASFEADLLAPRAGVISGGSARWRLERHRRALAHGLASEIDLAVRRQGLGAVERTFARETVGAHLARLVHMARKAASRSLIEQIWARWRLFHLPMFAIMVAATALHVAAVWPHGADEDTSRAARPALEAAAPTVRPARPAIANEKRPPAVAREAKRPPTLVQPPAAAAAVIATNATVGTPSDAAPPAVAVVPPPVPMPIVELPPIDGKDLAKSPPRLAQAPQPAWRPNEPGTSARVTVAPSPAVPAPVAAVRPNVAAAVASVTASAPPRTPQERADSPPPTPVTRPAAQPVVAAVKPPAPAPVAVTPAPAPTNAAQAKDPLYSELERRMSEGAMSLGGPKPRTLAEQVALLKSRQATGQFAHSLAETGFAHTGKHQKVECVLCHAKPLRLERSENPRACVDCHKSDDVHKGRQSDCASCHTANRWSEIVKRR